MSKFLKNIKTNFLSAFIAFAVVFGLVGSGAYIVYKEMAGFSWDDKSKFAADINSPETYDKPLLIKLTDLLFSIMPLNANAAKAQTRDNVVKYIDAFLNTDIVQTAYFNKIKEDIILKGPGHPEIFEYQIDLTSFDFKKDGEGNLLFYDKGHRGDISYVRFAIPAPFLIDADGKKSSASEVGFELAASGRLTLRPSAEWLKSAKYPVILDPTIDINILNVHSYPKKSENWTVEFITQGQADLIIAPDDQATIDDDEFVSLSCGDEARAPQILAGDVIFYPNWFCEKTAAVVHYTKKAGDHALRFEFGGQVAYAYNSDDYTKLLIHADGTGNAFVDSEASPKKAITAYGDATQSATQSKFGGKSAYLDGTGDYLSIPDSDDWSFGTNDFTIEGWYYFSDRTVAWQGLWQFRTDNNHWLLGDIEYGAWTGNKPRIGFVVYNNGATRIDTTDAELIQNNTWHHLAFVKTSGVYKIFIDGVQRASQNLGVNPEDYTGGFTIGMAINESAATAYLSNGYVDEFRVSKGIARWVDNFTPPVSAYTNSSWLTGYPYRKSIALSRASGAVTNYQMKLLVGESSGATGEDVDLGGYAQTDFDDLRFTTTDGTTLMDYWIESISGTTPNQLATVWVEFAGINTSATTFYMYYGNAGAAAVSMGSSTFIKFDDFERGNNGDDIGGGWTLESGTVKISTEHDISDYSDGGYFGTRGLKLTREVGGAQPVASINCSAVETDSTFAIGIRVYKPTAADNAQMSCGKSGEYVSATIDLEEDISWLSSSGWADSGSNAIADEWTPWFELRDVNYTSNSFDVFYNNSKVADASSMYTASTADGKIMLRGPTIDGQSSWIDNVIVRNWRSTEPSWDSWGTAEEEVVTAATGGTITIDGDYTIHTFTTDGTFTPVRDGNVEVLVVAGGGSGGRGNSGAWEGAGGGAGGVLYNAALAVTNQAYSVTVGNGGSGWTNGGNSEFSTLTAIGGGKGGVQSAGYAGGSGGGGTYSNNAGGAGTVGPPRQGYDGEAQSGASGYGGGGGGAGEIGGTDAQCYGGDGVSTYSNLLIAANAGENVGGIYYIAGGGGGYRGVDGLLKPGGDGGGGDSGTSSTNAGSATANTGGGGGGSYKDYLAGDGGSGIVIIKYLTSTQVAEEESGGYPACSGGLPDYSYRKSITLSRASGAVTNYQMKILVGESSGATGEDVDLGGHVQTDFDDLRFTKANGINTLDYWIESISGTTPNQLATVWVEFDSIGTTPTTFYMYYGNATASSGSNGASTFTLFDNFEWGSDGDSVTTGGWTIGGSTIANISTEQSYTGTRSMKVFGVGTGAQSDAYKSLAPADGAYSIKYRLYKENATNRATCVFGNGTRGIGVFANATEDIYYIPSPSADVDTTYNITADSWQDFEINNINFTSGTYDIYFNGTKIKSGAAMYTQNWWANVLVFETWQSASGNDAYFDNIVVRNWRSTEPAWGSWGNEENACGFSPVAFSNNVIFRGGGTMILRGDESPASTSTPIRILGEIFEGNVIMVGKDGLLEYDYDDPRTALSAASAGDLILIYPGTYSFTDVGMVITKNIYIRGMGDSPNDVVFSTPDTIWHTIVVDGSLTEVVIENLKSVAERAWSGAFVFRDANPNTVAYLNKLNLVATNSGYVVYFGDTLGSTSDYQGNAYLSYCTLDRGYATLREVGTGSTTSIISVANSHYLDSYVCDTCNRNPSPHNYVTSATANYGYTYGDYLIEMPQKYFFTKFGIV